MPKSYTPAEVADLLGCSTDTARDLINAGEIEAFNIGRGTRRKRWRVTPEAVEAFKRRRTKEAKPKAPRKRPVAATVGNWI